MKRSISPYNVALIIHDYGSSRKGYYHDLKNSLKLLGYHDSRIVPRDFKITDAIGQQSILKLLVIDNVEYRNIPFSELRMNILDRIAGLPEEIPLTYVMHVPKEADSPNAGPKFSLPRRYFRLSIFQTIDVRANILSSYEVRLTFSNYLFELFSYAFSNRPFENSSESSFIDDKLYDLNNSYDWGEPVDPVWWAISLSHNPAMLLQPISEPEDSNYPLPEFDPLEALRRNTNLDSNFCGFNKDRQSLIYEVWFGTNRKRDDVRKKFLSARDNMLHFGKCEVAIPKQRERGSIGSPWWKRIFTGDDRLKLFTTNELSLADFKLELAHVIATLPGDDKVGVVFIHGYNVSFEEAALTTAQLGFDLHIRGPMAFFSWPSQASVEDYLIDGATIEASEQYIKEFIEVFANELKLHTIHIIAHSMGNRALLRVMDRIVKETEKFADANFGHFILAAPDVDRDVFINLSTAYKKIAKHITLYVSDKDKALAASRFLHLYPRAGISPPVTILPGIDTIYAGEIDFSFLGHSYFSESRIVLTDIHNLIHHNIPAKARMGLQWEETTLGEGYWAFAK